MSDEISSFHCIRNYIYQVDNSNIILETQCIKLVILHEHFIRQPAGEG